MKIDGFEFEYEEKVEVPFHSLWVEKYRPRKFEDFIGNQSIKDTLQLWLSNKDIPHTIFHSSPGTGKTSIGKMLVNLIPCDSLTINTSDENGVDDIRNKVQDFCMTMGVRPLKVMFMDECLDENTIVWVLRDGIESGISIKNLDQSSDLVKSFNTEKNRIEWRPFHLISQGNRETYEIEFENGEIVVCTDSHKWYVKDESGNVIRIKTSEFISGKYTSIATEDN